MILFYEANENLCLYKFCILVSFSLLFIVSVRLRSNMVASVLTVKDVVSQIQNFVFLLSHYC